MKFIVSTTNLLKALQTILGTIKGGAVLPILEDFLFDVQPGKLTVSATDLEISMSISIMVESKEKARIAIPAKILVDTLKTLPEQPLTFKIDEKTLAVEITSESGRYKLGGEDASDFPKEPQPDSVTNINLPAPVLSNAIAKTLFACSKDDLRPAMTGVLFQVAPDGVTFVSTNAHCLVKITRSDVKEKPTQFIVPKAAVSLLKTALNGTDTVVNVAYNKSNAFFSFNNIKLIARLIDENYPDYNAVIPTNSNKTLSVNRLELLNAMKRLCLYSNETTYQVVLSIAGSELTLSAQNIDFGRSALERLTCGFEGEDIEIAFNARMLIETLSTLDSADIAVDLSAPTRAGIFRPAENDENEVLLVLVMPVMINA